MIIRIVILFFDSFNFLVNNRNIIFFREYYRYEIEKKYQRRFPLKNVVKRCSGVDANCKAGAKLRACIKAVANTLATGVTVQTG